MATRLGYSRLTTSTLNIEETINDALIRFDVASTPQINSRTTVTPPLAPVEGDVYIVPVGASAAWGAPVSSVVYSFGGFWYSFIPNRALFLSVADEGGQGIEWDGSAWVASSGGVAVTAVALSASQTLPSTAAPYSIRYLTPSANGFTVTLPKPATDARYEIFNVSATFGFSITNGVGTIVAGASPILVGTTAGTNRGLCDYNQATTTWRLSLA